MATHREISPHGIALATEPPFRLGPLEIKPAWRQVLVAGTQHTLEPRVMQALVVLARAEGEIVGRDELIARCWNGRVVGDNAINRVISLLRALAARTAAFRIQTITKVGYRLTVEHASEPQAAAAHPPAVTPAGGVTRRGMTIGAGAAAAAGAAYLLWTDGRSSRRREAERQYRAGVDSERLGDAGIVQALAHYRAAARADPDDAVAWGAIARALQALTERVGDQRREIIARQIEEADRRALAIDPRNADALLARVLIAPSYRNWLDLQRQAGESLARRPGLTLARIRLAQSLADTGRYGLALGQMRQALAEQPLLPGAQALFAWLLWQTGRIGDAAAAYDRAYRTWPDQSYVWSCRATFLSLTGRTEEALRMTERDAARTAQGGPLPSTTAALCAHAFSTRASSADRASALAAIRRNRRDGDIASFLAIPCLAALGDVEGAFEQTYDYLFGRRDPLNGERQPVLPHADRRTDFLFARSTAAMRADPRFPKLTIALGLNAYWYATGSRPESRPS